MVGFGLRKMLCPLPENRLFLKIVLNKKIRTRNPNVNKIVIAVPVKIMSHTHMNQFERNKGSGWTYIYDKRHWFGSNQYNTKCTDVVVDEIKVEYKIKEKMSKIIFKIVIESVIILGRISLSK